MTTNPTPPQPVCIKTLPADQLPMPTTLPVSGVTGYKCDLCGVTMKDMTMPCVLPDDFKKRYQPAGELPVAAIMSYWGAHVTYDFYCLGMVGHVSEPDCWMPFHRVLNNSDVVFEITDCADRVRNFKLHLFPLSSLSNDQVRELARLAGLDEGGEALTIEKSENHFCCFNESQTAIWLWFNEPFTFSISFEVEGETSDELNPAPLIAHLQRWGFFVPGLIGREWVNLIES